MHQKTINPWELDVRAANAAFSRGEHEVYIGCMREAFSKGCDLSSAHLSSRQRELLAEEGILPISSPQVYTQQDKVEDYKPAIKDEQFALQIQNPDGSILTSQPQILAHRKSTPANIENLTWEENVNYLGVVNNAFAHFEGHYRLASFPQWKMVNSLKAMKRHGCVAHGYNEMPVEELRRNFGRWQREVSDKVTEACSSGKCDSRLRNHYDWKEWRHQVLNEPYQ